MFQVLKATAAVLIKEVKDWPHSTSLHASLYNLNKRKDFFSFLSSKLVKIYLKTCLKQLTLFFVAKFWPKFYLFSPKLYRSIFFDHIKAFSMALFKVICSSLKYLSWAIVLFSQGGWFDPKSPSSPKKILAMRTKKHI